MSTEIPRPTEIVVLGGGYTGVWAARRILRELRPRLGRHDRPRVTLVATNDCHAFHGWTAEVITGHVRLERTLTPLAKLLPEARIVTGSVRGVDLERREVVVDEPAGQRRLRYDQLVLGVGSQDATERVPGLSRHGFTTKGDGQLARLITHLDASVAQAAATSDPATRARLLTVVVAGGGFAGVETAVAVRQRLQARIDAILPQPGATTLSSGETELKPRVVIVHGGSKLLPSLRPRFSRVAEHATRRIELAGIEIRCQTRLTGVTRNRALLDQGAAVETETVITTLGQRPVPLPGTEALLRDRTGRLSVDRCLRVQSPAGPVEGVWAGGDIASVPHPLGGDPCPASALWAIYHGARIGGNVVRALRGRGLVPFRFPGLGQAASFGVGDAAAELGGVPLLGWSGWLARWTLFHYYMPSRVTALRTVWEWLRTPGRVRPLPERARQSQPESAPTAAAA